MSIDLQKAFDMVRPNLLIQDIINSLNHTPIRPNTVRLLSTYLKGRMACVRYNNCTSPYRHARTGVPQGSCLSPVLFNFFVSTYPQTDSPSTSYADDFTDSYSDVDVTSAAGVLSAHASDVAAWAGGRGLTISAAKSTITLFTSDLHQSHLHPQVSLLNSPLPLNRNPRIPVVTFEPHFTFSPHIRKKERSLLKS